MLRWSDFRKGDLAQIDETIYTSVAPVHGLLWIVVDPNRFSILMRSVATGEEVYFPREHIRVAGD